MSRRPVRVPSWPAPPRGATQRVLSPRKPCRNEWEELLYMGLVAHGLHVGCERQHLYAPGRKFQADFCWPAHKLIAEVDGGIWTAKSGHSGGAGITKDMERGHAAALAGYRVLRFAPAHIRSGEALTVIRAALHGGEAREGQ